MKFTWMSGALLLVLACGEPAPAPEPLQPAEGSVHPRLAAHSVEFERRVYTVTAGVHVAVGFGLANSILVEGEGCNFVVDTLASVESARVVKAEFDRISSQPIGALVYTHNHADHVFGARGFVPEPAEVPVYSHATTEYYIDRVIGVIREAIATRSARMFGDWLPHEGSDAFVNAGIGPSLELGHAGGTLGLIRPNRTFDDELRGEICGVPVMLVHAPGETNDQIFVWLPEKKVLLPGDNVYKAFPNLYTIRGTLYRDVLEWVRSIDRMRGLGAEHLVPSHTRPVSGAAEIQEILTSYRDAIQFVHDQTIRWLNRGLGPDEIVERVKLPPRLAAHPYLEEFYGTVEWSVRAVYSGYLGWFDGDTATLSAAGPLARARGYATLAGGEEALLAAAREAAARGDHAFAAELATHLLRLQPNSAEARETKAQALRVLGQRSISANGRNYYLTQAREIEGRVVVRSERHLSEGANTVIADTPIRNFLAAMPPRLDPERSADTDIRVGFRFSDVGEGYGLHVRRGVAELQDAFPADPDVSITTTTTVWKDVVTRTRNPALAFASGDVAIEGSALDLVGFLRLFD
jgi:alkyl sulfatase BDS1-like metallo-beta-lactamase superfamily hydrolase